MAYRSCTAVECYAHLNKGRKKDTDIRVVGVNSKRLQVQMQEFRARHLVFVDCGLEGVAAREVSIGCKKKQTPLART